MAAYAAVVSVMHVMEQIKEYHARHPIFLDKQQRQLESLQKKVSFLQDFIESYSSGGNSDVVEGIESRIVDAAYAIEDVVESYVVNDCCARSGSTKSKKNNKIILGKTTIHVRDTATCFSQNVQCIIEYIDSIKRQIVEMKDVSRVIKEPRPQELERSSSQRPLRVGTDSTMIGFNDIFNQVVCKVVGQPRDLQVISICGMGGSGKSTLAKNIYDSKRISQHFDIRSWVTVSQEFNAKELLLVLLKKRGDSSDQDHQLGEALHKLLSGRRYFIVIDDIWSQDAWDKVALYFPDNTNGSRIIITTRLLNLAHDIGSHVIHKMNLLNESESWSLLHKKVFAQESCPPELEEIGKEIAKNCRGLPLSIVVIGGLLAKSVDRDYWENIAKDVSGSANSGDIEHCMKTLYMSYHNLPVHLKPCFLYFGVFPEDHKIIVSRVVKLWTAEGFLKQKKGESLEEVARDNLRDLIERNLININNVGLVGRSGSKKTCNIHDLLRDLCVKEAAKQRFFYATKVHCHDDISKIFSTQRRVVLLDYFMDEETLDRVNHALRTSPFIRSLIHYSFSLQTLSQLHHNPLLRALGIYGLPLRGGLPELLNLRYVYFGFLIHIPRVFPSSILQLLWNLQTIYISVTRSVRVQSEIWGMSQLRHVKVYNMIMDDPYVWKSDGHEKVVLKNLQSLSRVIDFHCSEEVLMRIPNLKKLALTYEDRELEPQYIKNIGRLTKLESLTCEFNECVPRKTLSELEFPRALRKLSLSKCDFNWEDIGEKIGLLPLVEQLYLSYIRGGEEWNSVEGQFPSLKYLMIEYSDVVSWAADSMDFPRLEKVSLRGMDKLEAIPSEIGDIPTFQSLQVYDCSDSANDSAKRIRDYQMNLGNEYLRVAIGNRDNIDYAKLEECHRWS